MDDKKSFITSFWEDSGLEYQNMRKQITPDLIQKDARPENHSGFLTHRSVYAARVHAEMAAHNKAAQTALYRYNQRIAKEKAQLEAENARLRKKRERATAVRRFFHLMFLPLILLGSVGLGIYCIVSGALTAFDEIRPMLITVGIACILVMGVTSICLVKSKNKGSVGRFVATFVLMGVLAAVGLLPTFSIGYMDKLQPYRYQIISTDGIDTVRLLGFSRDTAPQGEYELNSIDGYMVSAIAPGAFANCKALTKLTVPESVQTIEKGAFKGLSALEEISLPFVGQSRDSGMMGTDVTLDEVMDGSLAYTFGKESFSKSYIIEWIGTFSGVTALKIDTNFYLPKSLQTVTIRGGQIWDISFYGCNQIKQINLPNGITEVGSHAFQGSGIEQIKLPDSVQTIHDYAFSLNRQLKEAHLSSALTRMGKNCFWHVTGLKDVYFYTDLPQTGDKIFYDVDAFTLHVPEQYVSAYKKQTWNGSATIVSF